MWAVNTPLFCQKKFMISFIQMETKRYGNKPHAALLFMCRAKYVELWPRKFHIGSKTIGLSYSIRAFDWIGYVSWFIFLWLREGVGLCCNAPSTGRLPITSKFCLHATRNSWSEVNCEQTLSQGHEIGTTTHMTMELCNLLIPAQMISNSCSYWSILLSKVAVLTCRA